MKAGLWSRLSLRWQTAIAISVPCAAVALFGSLYFADRLNAQAEESLDLRAQSVGRVASAEIGPTLRLIEDALASPEDLTRIFDRLNTMKDVRYQGVLQADGTTVIQTTGDFPPGRTWPVPREGCEVDRGEIFVLRCLAQDQSARGVFVAGFSTGALSAAQRDNQLVGVYVLSLAVVIGIFLAFLISRALAAPVVQVTKAAREVAAGDVTVPRIQITAASEIQSMASSFNEMLASLQNLVTRMVSLTHRLGTASHGLIEASRDQTQVTGQQSAYAQQIAATFEELSATAEQISRSTEVVETSARRTNDAVEQARAVMGQVVGGITEIRLESKDVADAILKLNEDLQQISKIAQVINQVAERSDLLALNAALEGTKAGEVGRGFSLVAAEMRKLAENVGGSAQDIARIIERVQASGNTAVAKARAGVTTADRGVQIVEQASFSIQQILELARGTTAAAQQIAVATRQQKQSSEQAVQGARNVADLVKRGVDATERTTGIAKDLQSVAQALTEVTSRFRA